MKILVLGSRIPYPQRDGGAIATFGMLKELSAQGADITYFSFNTKKHFASEKDISEQFGFCKVIPVYLDATPNPFAALWNLMAGKNYNLIRFYNKKANQALKEMLQSETFDIVHFESAFTLSFLNVVRENSEAQLVLRQHNVEYRIWEKLAETEANGLKKWYLNQLVKSFKKEEITGLKQFNNIVAITEEDMKIFKEINPTANHFYYPAGVDLEQLKPLEHVLFGALSIGHIGSMEWMPNVQGVQWFIQNVWPTIVNELPEAVLHIAGKGLSQADTRFTGKGILNHGEVDDAVEFVNSCAVSIVPLLSGSGLRMKTLEAMALGKAVISSSIGAAGINYKNGENMIIADSAAEWVSAIKLLLQIPQKADEIGVNARQLVTQNYSLSTLTAGLLRFYESIVKS